MRDATHYWRVIQPSRWKPYVHPNYRAHVPHKGSFDPSPCVEHENQRKSCHCVAHNMPVIDNWTNDALANFLTRVSAE